MEFRAINFGNALPVDGYGAGFFRIGGAVYDHPCLLMGDSLSPWGGYDDIAAFGALAGQVDVLFVGTGAETTYLPAAFRNALKELGLSAEAMNSPAACRTYNVLLSEGRHVALAVLPT